MIILIYKMSEDAYLAVMMTIGNFWLMPKMEINPREQIQEECRSQILLDIYLSNKG